MASGGRPVGPGTYRISTISSLPCPVFVSTSAAAVLLCLLASCTPVELPEPTAGLSANVDSPTPSVSPPAEELPALIEPLELGEPLPNLALVDQDGQPVEIADYLGTVLVVGFFSCRHPQDSPGPAMAQRLRELQDTLRADLWDRVHILTVSVEPVVDPGTELQLCAASLGADLQRWTLTTSRGPSDPTATFARLGVVVWPEADGEVAHTLSTLVVDPEGELADRFTGLSQWTVADLIASIIHTADR